MAGPGTVKIKVYNVIGDLVSKIEDNKSAGQQTSTMNTGRLAPGVYLYTLERDYGTHQVKSRVKKFAVKR
ncbi:MAG: T9SS type A sorting domain-containing protein [Elusimicrobiota bacterium]|nr:MAG: T9SS type A sorting domain-containing protein [Elusimicrobiota bacterium]